MKYLLRMIFLTNNGAARLNRPCLIVNEFAERIMTQAEFEIAYDTIRMDFSRKLIYIEQERIFTMNTHHVSIGDIIEVDNTIIKVKRIMFFHAYPGMSDYIIFYGKECNRQLKRTRCKEDLQVFWRDGQPLEILTGE